eukprot:1141003-Pelagomonas_calceolata.AAC.2
MPQPSTLPTVPKHPAHAQHQLTNARKLHQQTASGIHTRKLTSTGVVQGRVRHQKTTMNVCDPSHVANLGVEIVTQQHMRGKLTRAASSRRAEKESVTACTGKR